eukprot:TRINITY_DN4062_c0_g1_i5.p1 TRINITY_DN4062_c0_g1~~TRINITY_DN4062_c0_g1_i5.p1  ORF type:complete len:563 (+),score=131.75 TRINITY_DN4062_c0_g1_i5:652-2340(+)
MPRRRCPPTCRPPPAAGACAPGRGSLGRSFSWWLSCTYELFHRAHGAGGGRGAPLGVRVPSMLRFIAALALLATGTAGSPGLLRVPMPVITIAPWVMVEVVDGVPTWYAGFMVDFWKELGYAANLTIEFVPVGRDPAFFVDFSTAMHNLARGDTVDLSWDVFPPEIKEGFAYTAAVFHVEEAIILRRERVASEKWAILEPFHAELWYFFGIAIFAGGAALLVITSVHAGNQCTPAAALSRYPTYVYHTAIALFGGDDFDEYHLPTGGRVFRFGLLFLATMFSATYTANLAAFLVRPKYRVHGPRTFEELKGAKACIWDTTLRLQEYAGSFIAADETLPVHLRIEWAMEQLKAGACEAAIVSRPDAHLGVLDNCETLVLADSFFNPKPLMAIIREDRRDLTVRVNNGILSVTRSPAYAGIVARYMRYTEQCVDSSPDQLSEISVTHMAVPFIVFAVCGVLALLVTAVQHARRASPREGAVQTKEEQQNEVLGKALGAQLTALATKVEALEQQAGPAVRPAYSPPHPQPIPAGAGRGWAPCDALRPQDAAAPPLRRPRSSWVKF